MNKILLIITVFLSFFWACEDLEVSPNESFVKIYGNSQSSQGVKICKLPDGRTILTGQAGTVKLEINDGILEDIHPAFTMLNTDGTMLSHRLYTTRYYQVRSYYSYLSGYQFEFTDVLPLESGQYMVIGQMSIPAQDFVPFQISLPFFQYLDASYNQLDFISPFESPDWDGHARTEPQLFQTKSGDSFILYKQSFYNYKFFPSDDPTNHSLQKIDKNGNTLWTKDYFDRPVYFTNYAWDMVENEQNNLTILAQNDNEIYLYHVNAQNGEEMANQYIDEVARPGRNQEPGKIQETGTGYVAFYEYAEGDIRCVYFDNYFQTVNRKSISRPNQKTKLFARDAETTPEGDVLLLIEESAEAITGKLIKLTPAGNTVWEYHFDGAPADVEINADGSILLLYNAIFNGQKNKMTLTKLRPDGTL